MNRNFWKKKKTDTKKKFRIFLSIPFFFWKKKEKKRKDMGVYNATLTKNFSSLVTSLLASVDETETVMLGRNKKMDFENFQLINILNDIAKYIPPLNCVMEKNIKPTQIKNYIIREKRKMEKEYKLQNLKCYLCGTMDGDIRLKQLSTLSRCSDELIETHFVCKKCQ